MATTHLSSSLPTADGGPAPEQTYDTLIGLLWESIGAFSDKPLFGTKTENGWSWLTYAEFGRLAGRMRDGLASLGVGRGDRVAIIAANRVEWAVCAYAAYGLGAAYVPMYETQTDKDWEYIIKDSGAKVLFVANDRIRERVKAFHDGLPDLSYVVTLDASDDWPLTYASLLEKERLTRTPDVTAGDLAVLIYTSGTTGQPKGVMLTHRNICTNLAAVQDMFPIGPGDRSLSFLPWAHVFGHTVELHCMLSMGASIALCEGVEKLIDNLAEVRPTVLFSVPKIFNRIYNGVQKQIAGKPPIIRKLFAAGMAASRKKKEGGRLGLGEALRLFLADKLVFSKIRKKFGGQLRFAIAGGAKLETEVARFIDGLGIQVHEGYGLSETSPIVSANSPASRKLGSVGKPVPGVRVVIDPSSEIVVYGPNVMSGYYGLPEETASVFTGDGGFRTGDMGSIDEQGFLFITGRIKEQYKLENGKYVVPSPLEEQLKLSPLVLNVMVYGDNRPHNVALVVPDPQALAGKSEAEAREMLAAEIKRCSAEFKNYEKIRDFAVISEDFTQENGMLTPTLKLKRRNVLARWGDTIDSLYK